MKTRTRKPFVTSVSVLRGLAAGITMLSFAGMTAFAAGHLHNTAAPLQPAAAATAAPVTTSTSTGRLQLSRTVTTTSTSRAVTTTHHS